MSSTTPETTAVINTGPVIALVAALGSLDILSRLYPKAILPREVWHELLAGGEDCLEVRAVRAAVGIEVGVDAVVVKNVFAVALDLGEAAVIQMALDRGIDRVVLDERLGRKVAAQCGLCVTGTLGILLRAKRAGILSRLSPCVERMRQAGIRIAAPIVQSVLAEAGEAGR